MDYIAHVKNLGDGEFKTHSLKDHLAGVAERASSFAREFESAEWAGLAGRWHDLGKFSAEFQNKIRRETGYDADAHIESARGRVDHSTAGAIHAIKNFGDHGRILAYLIAGHHTGLPDWYQSDSGAKALSARLEQPKLIERVLKVSPPTELLTQPKPASKPPGGGDGFALWIRMLFSCLVDADFLDTEAFMDEGKAQARRGYPAIFEMKRAFDSYMEKMVSAAERTPVNDVRADVLRQCHEGANEQPGVFSLTVPTGGGKTLSSLAFALEHAIAHEKDRIIYAIPYTSIIEQTADVFRDVFKQFPDVVVEHHSNVEWDDSKETFKSRLATENWDAPLIVTTNVQFFESLFASRTSRCRKLHNIVNSVVILDEAQLTPPEFLQPIMDIINLLAAHYRVTFVLSTATQPALNTIKDSFGKRKRRGIDNVKEIIGDVDSLYASLDRVNVTLPTDFNQRSEWDELAQELGRHETVLAIVNTRNDCRDLWGLMPEGTIHLSALMCGAHRSDVIRRIKERLENGVPTRVVSTQLVEAGVDLDFPVVYRALAGLDSIAQAAGRCNREGKRDKGQVVVFVPPKTAPQGLLRFGEYAAKEVLSPSSRHHDRPENPLERRLFSKYFDLFLDKPDTLDREKICDSLKPDLKCEIQFRAVAEKFRLIEDGATQAVFVQYNDKSRSLINQLKDKGPERWLLRKLQRHSVNIYPWQLKQLLKNGDIEEIQPELYAQVTTGLYSDETGLRFPDSSGIDPSDLCL